MSSLKIRERLIQIPSDSCIVPIYINCTRKVMTYFKFRSIMTLAVSSLLSSSLPLLLSLTVSYDSSSSCSNIYGSRFFHSLYNVTMSIFLVRSCFSPFLLSNLSVVYNSLLLIFQISLPFARISSLFCFNSRIVSSSFSFFSLSSFDFFICFSSQTLNTDLSKRFVPSLQKKLAVMYIVALSLVDSSPSGLAYLFSHSSINLFAVTRVV